ncbi:hypothetical protein LCGC14_2538890 [marine sediment metagenome]|uniref:Uncharacterized protein n=1 Tax=marine sediment metagenome TaxID=412755 RepID=A0A0F9DJD3_9ZZZZ
MKIVKPIAILFIALFLLSLILVDYRALLDPPDKWTRQNIHKLLYCFIDPNSEPAVAEPDTQSVDGEIYQMYRKSLIDSVLYKLSIVDSLLARLEE